MMAARLRLLGADDGVVYPLEGRFTIGRLETCSLPLPDDTSISREHAVISCGPEACSIEDAGSRNGTYLERGTRMWKVAAPTTLEEGDVIRVGAVRLRFESTAPPPAPAFLSETLAPGETAVGVVLPAQRPPDS
jgi:pSer/pThr/pTyr-binding forkhead associated (FHA) protein